LDKDKKQKIIGYSFGAIISIAIILGVFSYVGPLGSQGHEARQSSLLIITATLLAVMSVAYYFGMTRLRKDKS
jgi:hypothetical protein